MKIKTAVLLLMLLGAAQKLKAQKSYSLQDCINTAIENNLELALSKNQVSSAHIDWKETQLSMLPTINAFANYNQNIGRTIDPFSNLFIESNIRNSNMGINSSLLLFQGLQLQNTIKARKKAYLASMEDYKAAKETMAVNIAAAFLNAVLASELIRITEQQLASNEQLLKQAEAFYEVGNIANVQLLDLKAQIAQDNLNLVNARNTRQTALVTLWNLMNIPYDSRNDILVPNPETIVVPKFESPEEVYQSMVVRAPVIRSRLIREESARYALNAAQGLRSPRLSFGSNLNTIYSETYKKVTDYELVGSRVLYIDLNNNPVLAPYFVPTGTETISFRDQLNQNLGRSFGFNLSIPILNGWQVNSNVKRARLAQENARLTTQQAKNQAYQDVVRAFTEYKAAEQTMSATKTNLDARTEAYNYARERYQAGALKFADYNVQDAAHLQAEIQYSRARFDFLFRAKVLDIYKNGVSEL